jgi:plastocyanin
MRGERGRSTRPLFVAIVAVVMVVMLAVTAVAITKTTRAASGNRWKPKRIEIHRGDRVRWRNPTNRVHDVTAWGGNWRFSEVLSPGERVRKRFRSRGTFKFRCARHSGIVGGKCQGMCGVVKVTRR